MSSTAGKVGTGTSLATALYAAGGHPYQLNCSSLANIEKWKYLRTPGGDLSCKVVFHVHLDSNHYVSSRFYQTLNSYYIILNFYC